LHGFLLSKRALLAIAAVASLVMLARLGALLLATGTGRSGITLDFVGYEDAEITAVFRITNGTSSPVMYEARVRVQVRTEQGWSSFCDPEAVLPHQTAVLPLAAGESSLIRFRSPNCTNEWRAGMECVKYHPGRPSMLRWRLEPYLNKVGLSAMHKRSTAWSSCVTKRRRNNKA
jgi:hypothetical protein